MKKIISLLLAVCSLIGITACGAKLDEGILATNEVIVSEFEDYYDIQKINYSTFVGSMSLNEDSQYVLGGTRSGKLFVDYTDDPPSDYNDHDGGKDYSDAIKVQFGFRTELLDSKVRDIENVDAFEISVYNANKRDVDLIFAVKDDGKNMVFCDGRTLEAGKWSSVSFDIKSYFFDNSIGISEYVFYIYDEAEGDSATDLTLYFDNCKIKTITGKKAPVTGAEEREILNFDSMEDNGLFLTTTSTPSYPAFFASYTGRSVFEGQAGALMVTLHNGINWEYDVVPENNGYKIRILDSVVKERTANAKGISVDCMNDGYGDLFVSLVAESATKTAIVKTLIPSKTTQQVVLDDLSSLEGEKIEHLTILIDNWNLLGTYHAYFRNLKIKK